MQWAPLGRNVDPERHVETGTSWPLVVVTALDAGRNWSLHDVIELRVEFGALILQICNGLISLCLPASRVRF